MSDTHNFFSDISSFSAFAEQFDAHHQYVVPDDWYVIITDVQGSTEAVNRGQYKDVNVVGASCIIAVLNAVKGMDIPYVFGGDGASFIVPQSTLPAISEALLGTRTMAQDVFGLTLRVGAVPVSKLYNEEKSLKVSKYQVSPAVHIAMFHGGGLAYAEDLVKGDEEGAVYGLEQWVPSHALSEADFSGLECRWNPVKATQDQIVTLMVVSRNGDDAYKNVINKVNELYDRVVEHNPTKPDKMKLSFNTNNLSQEFGVQTHKAGLFDKITYFLKMRVENILGTLLLMFDKTAVGFEGKKYVQDVAANTDFQKFDDTLRMILDSSRLQTSELVTYLKEQYQDGALFYGVNISDAAMMTCLIFERTEKHIHFIDGQSGGYTLAAKSMKRQIKAAVEQVSEALGKASVVS